MMSWFLSLPIVIISLILMSPVLGKPAMDSASLKYEEYVIEHEISATQARNIALSMDFVSVTPDPGCQECTKDEKQYCMGSGLIGDHCCCDKRFHEVLSFIPHTCYFGTQLCTPVVGDCLKYRRIKECCCDKYLLQKWKEKLGPNSTPDQFVGSLALCLSIAIVVNIFV